MSSKARWPTLRRWLDESPRPHVYWTWAVPLVTRLRLLHAMAARLAEAGHPVVAVDLLVKTGTRWEQPANAGISNFLQAVLVKGTAKRSGGEVAEALAGISQS